ncbi:TolC family protein [Rheinheimera sp.]|uniref:TolC family protein n=1 Tax=Rheinheimera sp. TaxID=1869214 RepID=UPI003D2B637B
MTKLFRLSAIALLLSLGGCVSSEYQIPAQLTAEQPLPAQYQLEAAPARWWQQLNDPQLMTLLQQAGAQNASLLAASANVKRYAALQSDAADNDLPQLTAAAGMERSQQGKDGVVSSRYQQGASLAWQLDLSGAVALAAEAAQQDREIALLRLQEVQLAVLTQVARHYGDWLGAQLQIDVAQANLANLAKTRTIVQAQLDAGSASALELTRLQAQVYQVEAGLPALYLQQSQAQLALAALTAQTEVQLTKRSLPQFSQPLALSQWQDALTKRPDLAIAERQLAKAHTQLAIDKAAWYPQLSLQGFLGFVSLGSVKTGSDQQSWSLAPSLSLPAADPMSVADRIDASSAGTEVALQQYRAQVFAVMRDVKGSLDTYNQGRRAQLLQQQQLAASAEAVRLTQLRYQSGMADFLQLLDAERELLSARDQAARLSLANYQHLVGLYQEFAAGLVL